MAEIAVKFVLVTKGSDEEQHGKISEEPVSGRIFGHFDQLPRKIDMNWGVILCRHTCA